jgi:hypothetical protein
MYFKNALIFFLISSVMISPKVNSQEMNHITIQELVLDKLDPNQSVSKNIENLKKTQFICDRVIGRKVTCASVNGEISLSKRGRSTSEVVIPPIFFDIYPEDRMPMLLDAVIDTIGDSDYEMRSIGGLVFIFTLSDRSFILSIAGLIIKTLNI